METDGAAEEDSAPVAAVAVAAEKRRARPAQDDVEEMDTIGAEDEGDEISARKRRRGVDLQRDVERRITQVVARYGERNQSADVLQNVVELVDGLEADLESCAPHIATIIYKCVTLMPDRTTAYSTLVGLLNAKNFNFGGVMVETLVAELNDALEEGKHADVITTANFLVDLLNARVLTAQSVLEFLEGLCEAAFEENVPQRRTDHWIHVLLQALTYCGHELAEKRPEELTGLLEGCEKYMEQRSVAHADILKVWPDSEKVKQRDFLDSLWIQIVDLRQRNWCESITARHYQKFTEQLAEALQHNLPGFSAPKHTDTRDYPSPTVTFRLFEEADCPEDGPALPASNSIDRFLVERELLAVLDQLMYDRKACATTLLTYDKKTLVPLNHIVLELIFGQLLRLPEPPHLPIYYGALLIELCRLQVSSVPQVLAQLAEVLFQRTEKMQPIALDRFVDWFSYHLSNFLYRWSYSDWKECIDDEDYSPRKMFAREVLEKCMRLSYYDRLVEVVPNELEPLLPEKPAINFVLDDETDPRHERAAQLTKLIQDRMDAVTLLDEIKGDGGELSADSASVFFSVLLNLAQKTIAHNFSALARYHRTLKAIGDSSDDLQLVLLNTLYETWRKNRQLIMLLVDKLLKMEVVDCGLLVEWLFSDTIREQFNRQWVWEMLNTAVERLGRHITKVEREAQQEAKKLKAAQKEAIGMEEGMATDVEPLEQKCKDLEVELQQLHDFQKNLFLNIFHKFLLALTEHVERATRDGTPVETAWFDWILGRFRHVFLAHHATLWRYRAALDSQLFDTSAVELDERVLAPYREFCAYKR